MAVDDDRYSDESSLEDDGLNEYLIKDDEDERQVMLSRSLRLSLLEISFPFAQLMAMPELEREKILFERQERRRDIEERNKLRLEQRKKRRFFRSLVLVILSSLRVLDKNLVVRQASPLKRSLKRAKKLL